MCLVEVRLWMTEKLPQVSTNFYTFYFHLKVLPYFVLRRIQSHWALNKSSLFQVMVCHLLMAELGLEPVLTYCQLEPKRAKKQTSIKF